MKTVFVVAKDSKGKMVCLYVGDNADAALKIYRDDKAVEKAGLTGEVKMGIFRNPPHYKRRDVGGVEQKHDQPEPHFVKAHEAKMKAEAKANQSEEAESQEESK